MKMSWANGNEAECVYHVVWSGVVGWRRDGRQRWGLIDLSRHCPASQPDMGATRSSKKVQRTFSHVVDHVCRIALQHRQLACTFA